MTDTTSGLHVAGHDFKLARQDSRDCSHCKHTVREITYEARLVNGRRLTLEYEPEHRVYKARAQYGSNGSIGALPSTSPLQAYQNLLRFIDEDIEQQQASLLAMRELRTALRNDALEKLT